MSNYQSLNTVAVIIKYGLCVALFPFLLYVQ